MMLPGDITKADEHLWAVEVDTLDVGTQGRTRAAALRGLASTVEKMVADQGLGKVVVEIIEGGPDTIFVTADDPRKLIALMLRRLRDSSEMSLADVTAALRAKSRNEWAQYEQGRAAPSIAKLQRMLDAIGSELVVTIVPRNAQVIPPADELDPAIEAVIADPSPANLEALKASVAAKHRRKARSA